MSRSVRATRYRPPPGFVIASSRDPGIEVYAPASPVERRLCAGCGGYRTGDPCLRCDQDEVLRPQRVVPTLDREEAVERARSWLAEVIRPAPEALAALDRLEPLDVPCDAQGSTLGALPPQQLSITGQTEPADEVPLLTRPLPTPQLLLVPVFAASYERDGRVGWLIVNAVDGWVTGERPVDGSRLRVHAVLGLIPGFALGFCIGTPALLLAGFGLLIWAAALALLLLGQIRWARMERRAYGAERW